MWNSNFNFSVTRVFWHSLLIFLSLIYADVCIGMRCGFWFTVGLLSANYQVTATFTCLLCDWLVVYMLQTVSVGWISLNPGTFGTGHMRDLFVFFAYSSNSVISSLRLRQVLHVQVAELSEPTSPELKDTIHSVVHGLLATLSPKMHSKAPLLSENAPPGTASVDSRDCAEIVENTSLHFQPLITLTRDYLARLLFWLVLPLSLMSRCLINRQKQYILTAFQIWTKLYPNRQTVYFILLEL